MRERARTPAETTKTLPPTATRSPEPSTISPSSSNPGASHVAQRYTHVRSLGRGHLSPLPATSTASTHACNAQPARQRGAAALTGPDNRRAAGIDRAGVDTHLSV